MPRSVVAVLLSLLCLVAASCASDRESQADPAPAAALPPGARELQNSRAPAPPAAAPGQSPTPGARGGYRGALPPIPWSPQAAAPPEVVRAVYEYAARRPDVLRYVPCFCGCERNGHSGNEDCFVARRDANGRPEWDAHGLT